MDRYFKKLSVGLSVGNTSSRSENSPTPLEEAQSPQQHTPSTQKSRIDGKVGCLNPANSFSYYNKEKVLKMAKLYPDDFDYLALDCLSFELDTFIDNFSTDKRFSSLSTLGEFSKTLVQSGLYKSCPHFFKLLKLALILPVSTATVERVFSAMKIIKTELRNKISDEFLNDTVVAYFECDLFQSLSNEDIMRRFQNMKTRRGQLP
ncbi:unnamed protein product [Amaranthus hypochondriacus]